MNNSVTDITVLKLGGELLFPERGQELWPILQWVYTSVRARRPVVIVHGGGPQTSALMRKLALEPVMIDGRRVTDESALMAMVMAVGGEVNARLTGALLKVGVSAVGLSGLSAGCVQCRKEAPQPVASRGGEVIDYGFVGEVQRVKRDFLLSFCDRQMVPVLACVGADEEGQMYNVNADTMASAVSMSLSASRLLLITGAPGVLRDPDDQASRWSQLTVDEAQKAIDDGQIRGGMIPKIREAFKALSGGVKEVHILGRLQEGELSKVISNPGTIGTVISA